MMIIDFFIAAKDYNLGAQMNERPSRFLVNE